MFLANWQHCIELQLLPAEAAGYLDILRCLEDEGGSLELVGFALEALEQAEPRLRAYALPAIARSVCRWQDGALRSRAAALVRTVVPTTPVNKLADFSNLAESEQADVIRAVAGTPVEAEREFGDIAITSGMALALALVIELQQAGRGDVDAVATALVEDLLRGDNPLWFVDAARAGLWGRQVRALTFEALLHASEPPSILSRELATTTNGTWLGSPDLVRIRLLLELAERGIDSPAERARWLVAEAIGLRALPASGMIAAAQPTKARPGPDLNWLRLRPGEAAAATLVLWQAIAYDLAVTEQVEAAAEALRSAWGAPTPFAKGVAHVRHPALANHLEGPLRRLARLRKPHPDAGGKPVSVRMHVDGEPSFPGVTRFLHSPWLDRATSTYNADADKELAEPAVAFPKVDDNIAMLRLFATSETLVAVVVGLHRAGLGVPDELWDALLNALDVRSSARLRDVLDDLSKGIPALPDRYRLGSVVLALGVPFRRQLDRAGKGQLHPEIPAGLVHRIERAEAKLASDSNSSWGQHHTLYNQAAAMAAAHMAYEMLSGKTSLDVAVGPLPWFDGGAHAPAARISRLILGPIWDRLQRQWRNNRTLSQPSKSIREPAALAQQAYPEILEHRRRSWDWLAVYRRPKARLRARLVLLSDPVDLEAWRQIDPLDRTRLAAGWLSAQTLRLTALLAAQKIAADDPWYVEWCEAMDRVNSAKFLPRDLRPALAELLTGPPGDLTAVDVHRRALVAVMEFSAATVRYQELAAAALLDARRPFDGVVEELGNDWLYAVVQGTEQESQPLHAGPWGMAGEAEKRRVQASMSEQFVLTARERGNDLNGFADVFDRVDVTRAQLVVETDAGAVIAHRVLLHRRTRRGVVAVLAPDLRRFVADPFAGDVADASDRLGLVADQDQESGRVWVNVGEAEPQLAGRICAQLGDPKLVQLSPLITSDPPLPEPRTGQRFRATVTWDGEALTVTPEKWPAWPVPVESAELLQRWLPDALAASAGPIMSQCLVEWKGRNGWIPVEADFLRLIVREFHGDTDAAVVLTICGRLPDEGGWRLSAAPGRTYAVPTHRMTGQLIGDLVEVAKNWKTLAGLRVPVRLVHGSTGAQLAEVDQQPLDDGNLQWAAQFDDDAPRQARWDGQQWTLVADADLGRSVRIDLDPPISDGGTEVTVRIVGWDEWAQRRGYAEVEVDQPSEATAASSVWPVRALDRGARRSSRPTHHGRRPDYVPATEDEEVRRAEAAQSDEWRAAFKSWQQLSGPHAEAQLVSGERKQVRLLGLSVPADGRPTSGRLDTIPLAGGERLWLYGRLYNRDRIRVRLTEHNGRWQASYWRAAPLNLAEFTRDVLGPTGEGGRFQMWFAGRTADNGYRFEWGYGWTLVLTADELDIDGRGGLFFGDCVQQLRIVHDRPDATPRLRIGHISWSVERRIYEDAKDKLLHAVQVRLEINSAGTKFANVAGVHLRFRGVPRSGASDQATKFERVRNADFDENSQALITAAASQATDTITLLARLDTQLLPKHGNGARLTFIAVLPGDSALAGTEHAPRENESVVLVADEITKTEGNDYRIGFHLPGPDGVEPALRATVLRREFSLRESTLREAYRRDPDVFRGVPMLVRLKGLRGDRWDGSVVDAPLRPARSLLDWAESD